MSERFLVIMAAISMFVAVACGAFGAHGLRQILDVESLAIWHTAVNYQMIHSLGILAVTLLIPKFSPTLMIWAGYAMCIGIVIFSGSLYALALSGIRLFGAITPIGGLAFLVGWLVVAWASYSKSR